MQIEHKTGESPPSGHQIMPPLGPRIKLFSNVPPCCNRGKPKDLNLRAGDRPVGHRHKILTIAIHWSLANIMFPSFDYSSSFSLSVPTGIILLQPQVPCHMRLGSMAAYHNSNILSAAEVMESGLLSSAPSMGRRAGLWCSEDSQFGLDHWRHNLFPARSVRFGLLTVNPLGKHVKHRFGQNIYCMSL